MNGRECRLCPRHGSELWVLIGSMSLDSPLTGLVLVWVFFFLGFDVIRVLVLRLCLSLPLTSNRDGTKSLSKNTD